MLPYTPLHHLLMRDLGFPIVATSGNLSGEPICIDEFEASARLGRIADIFLVHNRPIARAVDDSVACIALGKPLLLRRARGYAPLPVPMPSGTSLPPLIAVGAHQKNTLAIAEAERLILSQHIGDLENAESERAFSQTLRDLAHTHAAQPRLIVCDAHPDSPQHAPCRAARHRAGCAALARPASSRACARLYGRKRHQAAVPGSCMGWHRLWQQMGRSGAANFCR